MMKRRAQIFIYIIACCTLILFGTVAAVNAPKAAIKLTLNSILDTLKDKSLSLPAKKEERRNRIRTLIRDRFDFEEMAKRSLARHWKKRSPEEKKEFVSVFSELLEASYIAKIEAYTDEKITYDKEVFKGNGKYSVVNTTIVTKNVDIPIDYKLILKNNKWWIYDVVIEGVSFISTYRSQYNKIIVKESYAKLIQKMKNKLDEIKTL
jgi:phospholipid transport system substrate-binding protein